MVYPEVEVYEKAKEQIEVDYRRAYNAVYTSHHDTDVSMGEKRHEIRDIRLIALKSARRPLLSHPDPMVRHIAEHSLNTYYSESLLILKELPATFEILQGVAEELGWCSMWDEFVDEAIRDGVNLGMTTAALARWNLTRWLKVELDADYEDVNYLNFLVDRVVAAETKQ